MIGGLIGKKIGMTQVFDENGKVIPVTVLEAGPCVVVQRKTSEKEGYEAIQLGLVERRRRRANSPMTGHFKNAEVPPTRVLREFSYQESEEASLEVGAQVLVNDVFELNDRVDIVGSGKGRGFQGVIKRHGFSGGKATHGSMFHRAPGSIGQSANPSRVFKGMKGPGRMGNKRVKVRNLEVIQIDQERNLMLVKGAVPGSRGNYILILQSQGAGS
jgi:large subunit ribosomal protein L3